ncbi:uncharacterized protein LOC107271500 isoform X1 [Cephus cinctus]|uniref:Uncharacterized protein LOC107271500 isoform X1 n=1 Tax=Cephus cinctus TaxID=211228 RepID=A0AAJ7RP78_CEPCN|nr:uncharacterized protein LOC107271500 isoform X1 [Cephus cinctus]
MELVFSPGRINDNEGDPFQNEEVREWSHVDRLTGMLERARIETGRWQTRNQGAAHSYGKVIDSRERNSADGSVVQKARRQVEIFQSQAAGGRSYQVVRASQWSSSRVTDSTSTSPVPVTFSDTHRKNEADGKVEVKAGFRRAITATEDPGLNRLSQVSRLCRQIHNETLNNKSLTASKLNSSPVTNRRLKRPEVREDGRSLCLLNGKKSTSNEDITNLINEKDTVVPQTKFTRDCRTRRSLQITNSSTDSSWRDRKEANRKMNGTGSVRLSDLSLKSKATTNGTHKIDIKEPDDYSRKESTLTHGENESVQHENIVKKFDSTVGINRNKLRSYVLGVESSSDKETDSSASNVSDATTRRILSTLSFKDTTERDSESSNSGSENSPRRISTLSFKDFNPIRDKNDNSIDNHNEISRRTSKISFDKRDKGDRDFDNYEYHRPQTLSSIANISKTLHSVPSIKSTTSGKSNTTVVHLSSTPSDQDSHLLSKQNIVTVRSSGTNVGTIPVGVLQCRIQSSSVHHPNESLNDLDLERHKEYHLQEELDLRNQVDSLDKNSHTHNDFLGVSLGRPTKKVGFCKTEVHFAADSGKVNIVETDGKPPPSNKFRRRRRGTLGIPVINKNLPHIHFGDTSYEKYIFGGSNTVQGDKITSPDLSNIRKRGEFEKSLKPTDSNVIFDQKNGWGVRLKSILEPEYRNSINVDITSGIGYDNDAKTMDQKIRGHTTTVNLGANVLSKMQHIEQGKCNPISTGIHLRFEARPESLGSVTRRSKLEDLENSRKISLQMPSGMSRLSRPLIQNHQPGLKSTHLVMSLKSANNISAVIRNKISDDFDVISHGRLTQDDLRDTAASLKKNNTMISINKNSLKSLENISNDTKTPFLSLVNVQNAPVRSTNFDNFFSSLPACTEVTLRREEADFDLENNNCKTSSNISNVFSTKNEITSSAMMKMKLNTGVNVNTPYYSNRMKIMTSRIPNRIGCASCKRTINKIIKNQDNQQQYSSGSEQADEEVRSYMLGSDLHEDQYSCNEFDRTEFKETKRLDKWKSSPPLIIHTKEDNICTEESGLNNVDELLLNEISETIAIPSPEGRRKEPSIDPVERVCDKKDPVLGKVNKIDSNSVLSSDTENNPVLLKVVTTHKPVTAIVESDRSPDLNKRKIRSTIINKDERVIEHSKKGSRRTLDIMDRRAKHEAKDHCDNSREKITKNSYNKKDNNLDPVYVNVFDATESDVPLYENYQVDNKKESKEDRKDKSVNGERDSPLAELKRVTNETLRSVNERGSKSDSSRKDSKDESNVRESRRVKKHQLDTISESRVNDSEKRGRRKEIKLKGKERRLTSSSTSSIDSIGRMPSETVKRQNSKRHDNKSTGSRDSTESRAKSGNSREGSRDRKRVVDDVSDGKVTRDKGDSVGKEKSKNSTNKIRELAGNINVDKKLNGSTRSKKPIEIVYQTAVYNMKNEKLSKPLKTKESKSPRYINDLICGSKSKRPVDVKRVKATATSQQYTSNKGASQANRYWK